MRSLEQRLADVEARLSLLLRDTSAESQREASLLKISTPFWIVKPDASITKGSSDTCSVYMNETDTTTNITAKALGNAVTSGKWCIAWRERSGKIYVAPWEC